MDGADDRYGPYLMEGRFSVGACLCGLLLAWALASSFKAAERTPAHATGPEILVGSATLFAGIGCCFAFGLRLWQRSAHVPVLLIRGAALLFQSEGDANTARYGKQGAGRGRRWAGAALLAAAASKIQVRPSFSCRAPIPWRPKCRDGGSNRER